MPDESSGCSPPTGNSHSWCSENVNSISALEARDLIFDLISNLLAMHGNPRTTISNKEDKVNALVCVIASLSALPDLKKLCDCLLNLCHKEIVAKEVLYLSFAARSDLEGLWQFAEKDRHFFRNYELLCLGLIEPHRNPSLELLLLSLKKQCHWHPFLMEVVSSLLMKTSTVPVEKFLSHHLFRPLWPMALLDAIEKQLPVSVLKFLVEHTLLLENLDPSVIEFAQSLWRQLNVLDWAEEVGASVHIPNEFYSTNMSALDLLHRSCKLLDLGWEKVHKMILENEKAGELGASYDLATLDAFWACTLSFQCVITSHQIKNTRSTDYKRSVTDQLEKVLMILNCLEPFDLRVDVLEKIYSLLFLRVEDFHHEINSGSENSDEDADSMELSERASNFHSYEIFSSVNSVMESKPVVVEDSSLSFSANAGKQNIGNIVPHYFNHGFVCERHVTRDVLKMIQSSLITLKDLCSSLWRQVDRQESRNLSLTGNTDQVECRVDRLMKSVSEALWRLEILTSEEFVHSVSMKDDFVEKIGFSCPRDQFSWCYFKGDSNSDDEDTHEQFSRVRSDVEKSSESSSQSNVPYSSQDVKTKSNLCGRRRSVPRSSLRGTKDTIIKRMLSTETSLVSQCLVRGNLNAAKQILQTLTNADQLPIAAEVTFSEAHHNIQQKLNACAEEYRYQTAPSLQKSTLKAIQRAASVGVLASALSNEVETLLIGTTLPAVPNADQLPADFIRSSFPDFPEFFPMFGGPPKEQPIAVAAVDFSLMLSKNAHQFRSFLCIASKYCQELHNIHLSSSHRSSSVGFLRLVRSVLQGMSLLDLGSPSELLHRWNIPNLTSKHLRDSLQFIESLKKLIGELTLSRDYVVLYPKLLQLVTSNPTPRTQDIKHELAYLQEFKTYLTVIHQVCMLESTGFLADGALSDEHFTLLNDNPSRLLSSMVLNEQIAPEDLEASALQLGCSLPRILTSELCSVFPSNPRALMPANVTNADCRAGVLVLNLTDDVGPARHPIDAVYSLLQSSLSELHSQLQEERQLCNFEMGCLPLSSVNLEKMENILAAAWELGAIDMGLLKPGMETRTFYCNLSNLIWIHALISLQSSEDNIVSALFRGSYFHQTVALNSIAYKVGQLGILTLWEVRRLALGKELVAPAGTVALQQLALTTDCGNPLALFIVSTGSKFSPRLQALQVEKVERELTLGVQEYVRSRVLIESNQISVPTLIQSYVQYTKQNIRTFLLDNCSGSLQDQLDALPEDAGVILFGEDGAKECFIMDYSCSLDETLLNIKSKNAPSKVILNLNEGVSRYLRNKCPLIETLIQILFKGSQSAESEFEDEPKEAISLCETTFEIESQFFEKYQSLGRLCSSTKVNMLSQFYGNNILLSALHNIVPDELLWKCWDILVEEKKWQTVVDLLSALPVQQLRSDRLLVVLRDLAFMELGMESRGMGEPWQYSERISSFCFRAKFIIRESIHWPGHICLSQFHSILQSLQLKYLPSVQKEAASLKHSISTYQKILDLGRNSAWRLWQEVKDASQNNPSAVLDQILAQSDAELCISWIELHNIAASVPNLIDSRVIALLLNGGPRSLRAVERLCSLLSCDAAARVCLGALHCVRSVAGLQLCIGLISSRTSCLTEEEIETIRLASVGIQIFDALPETEQYDCMELVSRPHLMLEQLVMNMRLDAAEQVLNRMRPQLGTLGPMSPVAVSAIDSMLRQYAEKALEFRIVQGSSASYLSESSAQQTSISSRSASKECIMPAAVPLKSEWVPNEEASTCMNCQVTAFSMFSRRHHCRRCGRVVCALCSSQKMTIDGYGSLRVRVCDSCHSQMKSLKESETSPLYQVSTSPSGGASLCADKNVWRLSHSAVVNDTVRGEFAYEHAPSVSLCLSILKLHSVSAACPSFLVDLCDTILQYLQPREGAPNPELDYGLVVEMCRSLVVAAKVKCAQWGYVSDEPYCDQRLSQIDLIGLLVSHGCIALIPPKTSTHDLRKLQARLIEEELWELALEVSTKGGMERSGVWSVWGKGCLRAGRWEDAREKFAHCMPKVRSAVDPPLLVEILQILESTPYSMDKEVLLKAEALRSSTGSQQAPAPAVAVLHSLASLQNISQGKFTKVGGAKACLEPLVYDECCYYLHSYGSHTSYLKFLLRHSDLTAAVNHVRLHSLDPQHFFEWIYLPCLKTGQITALHSAMTSFDSTLLMWKPYLHGICASLEKRHLLHTLYEVQQWSKDHVRAAMTCIRFYHQNAQKYSHLYVNMKHLMRAQSHLEAAHAMARSGSNNGSAVDVTESMWLQLSSGELDHHLSTVWLQIEVTKFLRNCELNGRNVVDTTKWLSRTTASPKADGLPTLFGSSEERKLVAGLCIFCGKNMEEGYGVAFRIIEGFNLKAQEVYGAVSVALMHCSRASELPVLLRCIHSSGVADTFKFCDGILHTCISHLPERPEADDVNIIIRNISDPVVKISALILSGQLKSAYLLAVKHNRLVDIEHILVEAERLDQSSIKNICLKRLGRL